MYALILAILMSTLLRVIVTPLGSSYRSIASATGPQAGAAGARRRLADHGVVVAVGVPVAVAIAEGVALGVAGE